MKRLLKSKRASDDGTPSTLRKLVIYSIITLILIPFFVMVILFFKQSAGENLCKTTIMAKYGGKAATWGTSETNIALQCYTNSLRVTDDGVFKSAKGGKERKDTGFPSYSFSGGKSKVDINNERIELVKHAIAEEMAICWDQFWQGKLNIFTSGKRCVTCAEIEFENNWLDVSGLEKYEGEMVKKELLVNFGQYLNTQKMNSEMTYSDFFGGKFEPGFAINARTSTKIVFKAVANSWLNKWIDLTVFGCVVSVAGIEAGLVVSAYQETEAPISRAAIFLSPAGSCLTGFVVGAGKAFFEGSDFTPTMAVGPSGLIAEGCSNMY